MPELLGLKAGDIFTWDSYPFFEHEEKTRRWFLFLGCQSVEAIVFQITTTTKLHYYQRGNKRENHNFFKLPANAGGLEQESIIDLTLYFEKRQEKDFTDYQSADFVALEHLKRKHLSIRTKHLNILPQT